MHDRETLRARLTELEEALGEVQEELEQARTQQREDPISIEKRAEKRRAKHRADVARLKGDLARTERDLETVRAALARRSGPRSRSQTLGYVLFGLVLGLVAFLLATRS